MLIFGSVLFLFHDAGLAISLLRCDLLHSCHLCLSNHENFDSL